MLYINNSLLMNKLVGLLLFCYIFVVDCNIMIAHVFNTDFIIGIKHSSSHKSFQQYLIFHLLHEAIL